MLEIFSFIFGGVFRLVPEVMKIWDKQRERDHEARMLDLQMRADEQRAKLEVQKLEVQGEISQQLSEMNALIAATQVQASKFEKTGNPWLDAWLVFIEGLSATVRPVLTYWYCVVAYGAYKVASYYMIISTGASWEHAITSLWTPQDYGVMVSIIGFWFVDRALRKMRA